MNDNAKQALRDFRQKLLDRAAKQDGEIKKSFRGTPRHAQQIAISAGIKIAVELLEGELIEA